LSGTFRPTAAIKGGAKWTVASLLLFILPFTHFFIPAHSTDENRTYGLGYYLYIALQIITYTELCRDTISKIRRQSGIIKIELQILLIGGSLTATIVLVLMIAGAALKTSAAIFVQPFVVLLFYGLTVTAITTHKIFDATHLIQLLAQRAGLVCIVAGAAYGVDILFQLFLPEPIAFLLTTAVILAFASELHGFLDRFSGRYPKDVQARTAIISISKHESNVEALTKQFESILTGWSGAEYVKAFPRDDIKWQDAGDAWSYGEEIYQVIKEVRWATPESLARGKQTSKTNLLLGFLSKNKIGAVSFSKGATLEIILCVGTRASARPYTYPETQQLQEFGSIVESALGRSYLSEKAQKAERLAAVGLLGAGVAHEIRNPLVTIKTFVQLLPTHYNDHKFHDRFLKLIEGEVGRIERLTEQLLDLASPRKYELQPTNVDETIRGCVLLITSKADERRVKIITSLGTEDEMAILDANALKQVLLNLCFNAIQAQESSKKDRWVHIRTSIAGERLQVSISDNGPGISPEARSRLFQAFQTTKSSGFGLGLAICSEILTHLSGTIDIDPYSEEHGATFRISFPCRRHLYS